MAYYGSDGYDYERPGARRSRNSQYYLDPNLRGNGLHRTRSQGHSPAPQIHIHQDVLQDNHSRTSSPYPQYTPPAQIVPQYITTPPPPQVAPQYVGVPVPVPDYYQHQQHRHHRSPSSGGSSRSRGRRSRLGDEFMQEMAEMTLDNARNNNRSRSRGRSDAALMTTKTDYELWRYEDDKKRAEEREQRKRWEDEAEWKRMKSEREKKEDEERLIAEYEDKKRKDEEKRKAEEKRIKEKIEQDKRDAEAKEKREYEEFLIKQKKKEEEKKAKEKEEKEKIDSEIRRRMINLGYTDARIEMMLDEERAKKLKEKADLSIATQTEVATFRNRGPTYAKVHKSYLSVETLKYYDIPFEWSDDREYIIVLREMDKYETEVLFEHTRRLRSGKLLIEGSKEKDKQYAWFRKRDRSTSRVRKIGILEFKN